MAALDFLHGISLYTSENPPFDRLTICDLARHETSSAISCQLLCKQFLRRRYSINAIRQKYTGTPPLGYDYDVQGNLVDIPEELALAQRIRALRADRYSYHQIAHHLNEQGYRSKHGGKFYAASVREVVMNDHLYGDR
ncbi:MAG: recombinase family protein [Armatimonadota bacterium]